jgi:hypothetical protein
MVSCSTMFVGKAAPEISVHQRQLAVSWQRYG